MEQFLKLPVAGILELAIAEVRQLQIPPQHGDDIARRDRAIERAERTIQMWLDAQIRRMPRLVHRTNYLATVWSAIAGEPIRVLVIGHTVCGYGSEPGVRALHERLRNPQATMERSERMGWRYVYPIGTEADK